MQQTTIKQALGRLAELPHFFVWRLSDQDATGKYKTKLPWRNGAFDAKAARLGGALMSIDDALHEMAWYQPPAGVAYSLGYYFMPEDGVWFLDIDSNADPAAAQQAFAQLPGCFFEYSSSGQGVHFIGRWQAPMLHGTRPAQGIELYSGERGVCFGLSGAAWGSADVQMQPPAQWLVESLATNVELPVGRLPSWHGPEDDDELIAKMLGRSEAMTLLCGGVTLRQLWEGYGMDGDQLSEHDSSLATQLAWWTGCDQPRMQRLMMRSGRVRDKWLERDDYLGRTVKVACEFHMANSGERCLGWRPQLPLLAVPAAIEIAEVPLPVGLGVEVRAVAEEFGLADTLEHRGLAGAQLAIRSAGTMDELKAAAMRVAGMQTWDKVDLEGLAINLQRKSVELAAKLPIRMCRDMLAAHTVDSVLSADAPMIGAPEWLGEWCFVKSDAKFCHMPRNYLMVTRDTFDLVNATADGVPRKTTGLPGKASELWPDWRGENVDAMGFNPREGQFYTRGACSYCNAFVGTMPEPDYEPAPQWAIDAYMLHMLNLCNGDEGARTIVLQWMARIVQQPGVIPRWAIFMIGNEGTGKTMLLDALVAAIGPENVRVSGSKAVNNEGGFMDWAAHGKLLGVINDFVISGRNMYETAEAIKPVISDDLVSITRKGKPDFMYENFAAYFASANNKSPIPVTRGSRRWYFLRTSRMDDFVENQKTKAAEYFTHLVAAIRALTGGQWRAFFEAVHVPADFPIRAPWSAELDNVVANNMSEHKMAMIELIADHKIIPGNQIANALRGIEGAPTRKGVAKMMQDLGFNCWKERIKIDNAACTIYVHASLGNDVNEDFVKLAARKFSEIKDSERFAPIAT